MNACAQMELARAMGAEDLEFDSTDEGSPRPMNSNFFSQRFNARESEMLDNLIVGRRRISRHSSLYRKHDRMEILYMIRFGQFKLVGELVGDHRVAAFQMPGDLLGLDGVATGNYQFRAMALENSEVCEIPFQALLRLMAVEPGIQRKFLGAMGEMLNHEFELAHRLAMTSLEQRFAHFLLSLGDKYAALGYSGNSFRLSMSRSDIGGYIGTSVESVSRLIARFNAGWAASIVGRQVELRDRIFLEELIENGRAEMALSPPRAPRTKAAKKSEAA